VTDKGKAEDTSDRPARIYGEIGGRKEDEPERPVLLGVLVAGDDEVFGRDAAFGFEPFGEVGVDGLLHLGRAALLEDLASGETVSVT
jgi:hypothetical protein